MAERDITLSLDLDVKDAVETSKDLQQQVENVFKEGMDSPALQSLAKQLKDSLLKAEDLQAELEKLGNTQIETEHYKEQQSILQDMQTELQRLQAEESKYLENWGDTNSTFYTNLTQQINDSKQGIAEITQELEAMRQNGTAFISGKETAEYEEASRKLDAINDKLKVQLARHNQIVEKQEASNEKLKEANKLSALKGFKKGFSNLLKYAIGIRSLFALFNKLRQAIKEGFNNLMESNEPLKKQVDSLKGSLTQLKNSLASAFAPIVQTIIPYIQKLVDWLTVLFDKIAQFSAAIAGQKSYAKAIKQTGDAADAAGKKAKGSLGSFDKLNNITTQDSGKNKMFEDVALDSKVLGDVEKLKEAVKKIGETINKSIVKPFKKGFTSVFDTSRAQKQMQELAKSLTDAKDAFIDIVSDPEVQESTSHLVESTSATFGMLTGALLDTASTLGTDIIRLVITPFVKIKDTVASVWALVCQSTANALDAINEAFVGMWTSLQESYDAHIKPTVDNVIGILSGAYQWILEVFGTLWEWIVTNIGDVVVVVLNEVGPCVDALFAYIQTVSDALLKLWNAVLLPILNWVKDKIWPVIKVVLDVAVAGIKNAIKVVSNVIQVIYKFLSATIGAIVDLLTGKPGEALEKFKNFFKDAFENIQNIVQSVWDFLSDFVEGFFGIFEKVGEAIGSAFGGIKDFFTGGKSKKTTSVPGYASGQVIPPSMSAHLAILGDNNRETEVVSPLSTIRQAVTEAMQGMGNTGSGSQTIVLNLDGREFMRVLVDRNNDYKKQNGGVSAFA